MLIEDKRGMRIFWATVVALSVVLFAICANVAYLQRGYFAIGGEFVMLGIPGFIWCLGALWGEW